MVGGEGDETPSPLTDETPSPLTKEHDIVVLVVRSVGLAAVPAPGSRLQWWRGARPARDPEGGVPAVRPAARPQRDRGRLYGGLRRLGRADRRADRGRHVAELQRGG